MPVQAVARLRYVSIPPRKMRIVVDLVRGLPIEKALGILNFTPRVAAEHVAKTLKSAAANALSLEGTSHLHPEDLYVKEIFVQDAPPFKRIRFQSMGRVFRYKKRHCHLTVRIAERPHQAVVSAQPKTEKEKKAAAKETTSKTASKKRGAVAKKATQKRTAKETTANKAAKKSKKETGTKGKSAGDADK